MAESRSGIRRWQQDDVIEALRLETMQQLAEAAQLTAASPNVHLHKSANGGGTSIMVATGPGGGGGGEKPGQYQYMVRQNVAQKQMGSDFVKGTPTL